MKNNNTFEKMTNAELKELCSDFDLTVKAKDPSKPTKAEYLAALNAYKEKQDEINGIEQEREEKKVEESNGKPIPFKKLPKARRRALQTADLMRKERVIVIDTKTGQTPRAVISVNWGNGLIGYGNTDLINVVSGKPQYVRRGAIKNLENAIITERVQDAPDAPFRTETRARYMITPTEGLSEDEIKALANSQRMRNASLGQM